MKRRARMGFTLMELLVGMAIMAVVLTALLNYFMQGTRVSTQSGSRAELQQEILNAQQLIAGKLKEAWYVYPPGQVINMTNTELTRRPTGGNTWQVGADPILAMVLPPRVPSVACTTNTDGCYRFLAYYPVKRSLWVSNTSTDSWRNPGPDDANGETWVLAEYRGNIAPGAGGTPPATPPSVPTGNTANILSDYIAPTVATTSFTTTSPIDNTYTMFSYKAANGLAASATNPVSGVTINLATTRKTGGTTLRLPNPTDEYSITVYPTNLGKIAAN